MANQSGLTPLANGAIFIFSTTVAVTSAINASYYMKLSAEIPEDGDDTVGGVKRTAARNMMILNVVLCVLCVLVSLWVIYRSITSAYGSKVPSATSMMQSVKASLPSLPTFSQGKTPVVTASPFDP